MTAPMPPEERQVADYVAQRFHEEYEHLAPDYGWETKAESRVEWADLPERQRQLMRHVVLRLIASGVIQEGHTDG